MIIRTYSQSFIVISDTDVYSNSINLIEDAVDDDNKFPVVKDNKTKNCCRMTLELMKVFISYAKFNIKNGTEKKKEH